VFPTHFSLFAIHDYQVHHFRSFVLRKNDEADEPVHTAAWGALTHIVPRVLLPLLAIVIPGLLVLYRYDKPWLLYLAAAAAAPLLLLAAKSHIGASSARN